MAETFEDHLTAVEEGIRHLESGEETLERSLEVYEGAVRNLKACYELLKGAESRVKILSLDDDGNLREEDFTSVAEDAQ